GRGGGDGGGGAEGQGGCGGDGEPAHVGRHPLAVDLVDEQLGVRERRDGSGRADQNVHLLEEGEHALVEPGLLDVGAGDVGERQGKAALGVVDDVAVEQVARLLKPLAVGSDVVHAAQDLEDIVDAGEVGRQLLD